jgi:hypothetical protein
MKVVPVSKMFFLEGRDAGVPCIVVNFLAKKGRVEMDLNTLVTDILSISKLRTVAIYGKLSEEPEIKPLIEGLVSKGKQVVFTTSAKEDIGPVRSLPKVKFVLNLTPPNKKNNTIRLSNLPLLKEEDDLKVNLESMDDYKNAKTFLKSKTITRPTILFSTTKWENSEKFMEAYVDDCENFFFRSRLSQVAY